MKQFFFAAAFLAMTPGFAQEGSKGNVANGKNLFYNRMRCIACHVTEVDGSPVGGILGPNLSRIAERYGPEDFIRIITTPPGEIMPRHFKENLTAAELQDLAAFLMTLQGSEAPPRSGASRVDRGKWLFQRKGCFLCHGKAGVGGVQNYNYVKDTVPALNTLAERMMLFSHEDIHAIVEQIEKNTDLQSLVDNPPVPRFNVVLAQYQAIRELIRSGNRAGKKDSDGPQPPLSMPVWKDKLTDKDIDDIIAYLLVLGDDEQPKKD